MQQNLRACWNVNGNRSLKRHDLNLPWDGDYFAGIDYSINITAYSALNEHGRAIRNQYN